MLLNKSKLTPEQVELVRKAKKYFTTNVVTRGELLEFRKSLGLKSSPGFITKNLAFKLRDKAGKIVRGKYRLPAVGNAPSFLVPWAFAAVSMTKDAIRKRTAAAAKKAPKTMTADKVLE